MSHLRLLGYEILRRVTRAEVPLDHPVNPRIDRVVLGACGERYLVPPGIDILELGLIDTPGRFELLPVDLRDKPLWNEVVQVLITKAQAEQQRGIVMRSYRALQALVSEPVALHSSMSQPRTARAVLGAIRLETIETWKSLRHGTEPLSEEELDSLHESVAQQVVRRFAAVSFAGADFPRT